MVILAAEVMVDALEVFFVVVAFELIVLGQLYYAEATEIETAVYLWMHCKRLVCYSN